MASITVKRGYRSFSNLDCDAVFKARKRLLLCKSGSVSNAHLTHSCLVYCTHSLKNLSICCGGGMMYIGVFCTPVKKLVALFHWHWWPVTGINHNQWHPVTGIDDNQWQPVTGIDDNQWPPVTGIPVTTGHWNPLVSVTTSEEFLIWSVFSDPCRVCQRPEIIKRKHHKLSQMKINIKNKHHSPMTVFQQKRQCFVAEWNWHRWWKKELYIFKSLEKFKITKI